MKKALKIFLLGCLLYNVSAFSEDLDSTSNRALDNGLAHGVGIGKTIDSSWNFTYRKFFPSRFGINANIGGAFTNDATHVGGGIGGTYSLFHHPFPSFGLKDASVRVYLQVVANGIYDRDRRPATPADERNSFVFGVGVGPGVEYFLSRHFSANLDVPWMTKFRARNGVEFEGSAPAVTLGLTYYI